MKANKPLKAKTPLKSNSTLSQKGKLSKKPKTHTIAWYKREARKWFNKAVKYRDCEFIEGEWLGLCITCPRRVLYKDREGRFYRNAQAGHFIPETHNNTRFNELNVNLQCSYCNGPNFGEQLKYSRALDEKYGLGTAAELEAEAKIDHQFTIPELKGIIEDYKQEVLWYEKTPELSQPLGN